MSNLAFVFPGQGSQYVGMGRDLSEQHPAAAKCFTAADRIFDADFSGLCWHGPEEALNDTFNTQPAVFVTAVATLKSLRQAGFSTQPRFLAGHSLGEYVAYVAAGVLSFEDGLRLVRQRARLMHKAGEINPGGMAAILNLSATDLNTLCAEVSETGHWVQVANINAPGQIIVAGDAEGVRLISERAKAAGARRVLPLAVSVAPHTRLMDVVKDEFAAAVDAVTINSPTTPIIANINAQPLHTPAEIRVEMVEQLTSPVQWIASIEYMSAQGVNHFVEVGPKNVLSGLIRRIDRSVTRSNIDTPAQLAQFLDRAQE